MFLLLAIQQFYNIENQIVSFEDLFFDKFTTNNPFFAFEEIIDNDSSLIYDPKIMFYDIYFTHLRNNNFMNVSMKSQLYEVREQLQHVIETSADATAIEWANDSLTILKTQTPDLQGFFNNMYELS